MTDHAAMKTSAFVDGWRAADGRIVLKFKSEAGETLLSLDRHDVTRLTEVADRLSWDQTEDDR